VRYTWKENEIIINDNNNTYIGEMANKIMITSCKLNRPITENEMDLVIVPIISKITGVVKYDR